MTDYVMFIHINNDCPGNAQEIVYCAQITAQIADNDLDQDLIHLTKNQWILPPTVQMLQS